jgi:hypothetical protein
MSERVNNISSETKTYLKILVFFLDKRHNGPAL